MMVEFQGHRGASEIDKTPAMPVLLGLARVSPVQLCLDFVYLAV